MFVIEDKKEAIMHFINGTFVHSWFQFILWRAPRISPLSCRGEGGEIQVLSGLYLQRDRFKRSHRWRKLGVA